MTIGAILWVATLTPVHFHGPTASQWRSYGVAQAAASKVQETGAVPLVCLALASAGSGINGGQVYGKSDEFGWGVEDRPVHINDLHATMLHCFGLEREQLTYRFQGRDFRLTDVGGKVIRDWLA